MTSGNWVQQTVEDIKLPVANALATGPFGSAISSRFFVDHGVPVIRGSNLSQDTGIRLDDKNIVFISDEKAKEFARSVVRDGDLIFTCWGTIDQVGFIDDRARFAEYVISNKQMKLTPDPKKAFGLFIYYLFSSPEMRKQILRQGIGSSVPGFNLGQLKSTALILPPLPEQYAIANILGTLDDRIGLNLRMSETLEAMAQTLFKSWFVDFDPVRAKAKGRDPGLPKEISDLFPDNFEDSELGEIPAGWKLLKLSDVAYVNPTRALRKGTVAPYLDMVNMSTRNHSPNTLVDRAYGSGVRFTNGDTLMARITPCLENGKASFVDFLEGEAIGWGSTEFIVLRPRFPMPNEFAYCLVKDSNFREFIIKSMTGSSGRQRVQVSSVASYLIPRPSPQVAVLFGRLIQPLFARARAAVEQSRCLAALRDELLPRLVSGRIRIVHANRA